ncbi:serine protease [Entomophthora muscae]|uniref:Serine protease n=1 Tax=Entomophthora muscae TaxID=34485 RepID=A0ACC2SNZ9_9FUNG|nr:serine protease [Entomophthora muscae]
MDRFEAFNTAVRNAIKSGCVVITSTGNDDMDACKFSPACESGAITVGASDIYDMRANFSNWEQCLDVFAPGENILSLSIDGDPLSPAPPWLLLTWRGWQQI